ncbi:uncharacterized protein LOC128239995 isoform X2 [Mya arenaria]|uniref:uncharacterized protein LOC128239995 isoform X2 n=1 Tax=Mya arenaria TaxID=6604 RepID=UPI0022E1049A|nr:uncharacterized protein LOC128239995 isoform X2 [Mya arenaria]
MYVIRLHVTVAVWLVTMVPFARGNAFIDAYNKATNTIANDDTIVDKYFDNQADFYMQAMHENGPASSTIADAANFVNLLAIFFNVPTIGPLNNYDNFKTQLETVVASINGTCPLNTITDIEDCTQADKESLWRPINGICSNLKHPWWGTPKMAQLRLAPAFWENVGLVVFDPLSVHLTPVNSRGVQLVPNVPLIFNLQGTSTFTLAVTNPGLADPVCERINVQKAKEGNVDGIIISVTPNKDGCKVDFEGNHYIASGKNCKKVDICYQPLNAANSATPGPICERKNVKKENEGNVDGIIISAITNKDGCVVDFEGNHYIAIGQKCNQADICYQRLYVVIVLDPRAGGESTLTVGGNVVDRYESPEQMFDATDLHTFWIRINNDRLQVGAGSEYGERTVILEGRTDPSLTQDIRNTRHTLSISASQAGSLTAQFPVYDRIILETEPERPQSLASLPFLFESLVVRFGLRTPGANSRLDNKHVIEFLNTDTDEKLTVTFRATRISNEINIDEIVIQFRRGLEVLVEERHSETVPHVDFMDGNGHTHTEFSAFWVSAISNRVYAGAGNEVGKEAMTELFLLPEGTDFFQPNDVIVRSMDGDVSNPKHAQWMFDLKQWATPRKTSLTGRPLPTARDVSLAVHTNIGASTTWSDNLTMAVMQMGQFIDHDLIATPAETGESGHINCHCVNGSYVKTEETESRFCFNINITEKTDPSGGQGAFPSNKFDCFSFIRSSATLECNADNKLRDLRNREQLNLLTAYVDGSNIYGSEQTEADDLRAHDGHLRGFLATSDGPIHPELPISTAAGEGEAACNNDGDDNFPCHQAGDFRVNEQPGLASMHTLWVREHNRVAGELVQNHGYQDDTEASSNELHHAARRIVIAEYQNIVYNGYLRSFMDAKIFDDFKLNSCMDGSCSYDDSLNPSITNEWGIANRMGHTWINNHMVGEVAATTPGWELKDNFFKPTRLHVNGSDIFITNLFSSRCPESDRTIETAVTENLFRSDVRNAFDLAALNIQRGRDHGVSYCATRKALGLKVPATFQEAENMQLFSRETIALLESCYDNICDIDLFTAIVAERPLRTRTNLPIKSDSPIAETLNHIQGDMYRKLKLGDRFWYEFQRAGLNGDQKRAIGRVTMSTIICDNVLTEGGDIQPDAFLVEGTGNEKVNCNAIPKLDLGLFRKQPLPSSR